MMTTQIPDATPTEPNTQSPLESLARTAENYTDVTEWVTISLEPTLTLAHIIDLRTQLLNNLGKPVQFFAGRVEHVDTAALQLLLSFMTTTGTTSRWLVPSAALCHAAYLLGLSAHLHLPITRPDPILVK